MYNILDVSIAFCGASLDFVGVENMAQFSVTTSISPPTSTASSALFYLTLRHLHLQDARIRFRVLHDMVCVPAVIIANTEHFYLNSPVGLSMTCASHEKHLGHMNIIPCAWDSI